MPTTNCPSSSLFERIKQLFGKKPGATSDESSMEIETNAVRKPSSSYTKLQGLARDSGANMPVVTNPGADEAYQATRSGAAATSQSMRQNTTINKLQALSASGTGVGPSTEQLALGSILADLEAPKVQPSVETVVEDQQTG